MLFSEQPCAILLSLLWSTFTSAAICLKHEKTSVCLLEASAGQVYLTIIFLLVYLFYLLFISKSLFFILFYFLKLNDLIKLIDSLKSIKWNNWIKLIFMQHGVVVCVYHIFSCSFAMTVLQLLGWLQILKKLLKPGCLLHHFLVSSLDGALSLIQPQCTAMFVRQHLQTTTESISANIQNVENIIHYAFTIHLCII